MQVVALIDTALLIHVPHASNKVQPCLSCCPYKVPSDAKVGLYPVRGDNRGRAVPCKDSKKGRAVRCSG